MDTILCNQGYIITKKSITDSQIKSIKKDLRVKPFIQGSRGRFAKSFKIYLENEHKFCIPKFYGLNNFGKPKLVDFNKDTDLLLYLASRSENISHLKKNYKKKKL